MALGVLNIIVGFSLFISVVLITALFYQNGRFVENPAIFRLILVYLLILAIMQTTGVATNDHVGQVLGISIAAITFVAAWLKRKNFGLARFILAALLVIAPVVLFLS